MIVRILFPIVGLCTLLPMVSAGVALLLGMFFGMTIGNPYLAQTRKWTSTLLQISVVALGAAMNLITVGSVGMHGAVYTAVGIVCALTLGLILGKVFGTNQTTSILLSAGTAICGGSAIAAIAPVMRANDDDVSVSLATVFFLNASALFIFPPIGHWAGFDQTQFGLWCALAIHDTSSVVGASMQYGAKALEIATTVKLARALWIVPLTFVLGLFWARKNKGQGGQVKAKRPWFILGFLLMAALMTWIPYVQPAGHIIAEVAKRSLVLTLFLIGSALTRATLKNVGVRPLLHGVTLWFIVGGATFLAISVGLVN